MTRPHRTDMLTLVETPSKPLERSSLLLPGWPKAQRVEHYRALRAAGYPVAYVYAAHSAEIEVGAEFNYLPGLGDVLPANIPADLPQDPVLGMLALCREILEWDIEPWLWLVPDDAPKTLHRVSIARMASAARELLTPELLDVLGGVLPALEWSEWLKREEQRREALHGLRDIVGPDVLIGVHDRPKLMPDLSWPEYDVIFYQTGHETPEDRAIHDVRRLSARAAAAGKLFIAAEYSLEPGRSTRLGAAFADMEDVHGLGNGGPPADYDFKPEPSQPEEPEEPEEPAQPAEPPRLPDAKYALCVFTQTNRRHVRERLVEDGWRLVVLDLMVNRRLADDPDTAARIVERTETAGLYPVIGIGGAEMMTRSAYLRYVAELIDRLGPRYYALDREIHPGKFMPSVDAYIDYMAPAAETIREAGGRTVVGGMTRGSEEALGWLRQILSAVPTDVPCIHAYIDSDASRDRTALETWLRDTEAVCRDLGHRRGWILEGGADGKPVGWLCPTKGPDAQRDRVSIWRRVVDRVPFWNRVFYWQIAGGPTDSALYDVDTDSIRPRPALSVFQDLLGA